ncbi:MAG TPA: site-specific integrase [Opitutaceae bacterium]|nr:site-specific integrase [Opitutaceae bacterium]
MSAKTIWERTSVQNLLRERNSGRYYGRWKIAGKQIWRKLDTDVFTVAKLRLNDEASKIERMRGSKAAVNAGGGTMADLIRVYEERCKTNTDLAASSVEARLVALKKVLKTWPELAGMKPPQVSPSAVADWGARFKSGGTNYTPPGAKKAIRGNSATSVNRAIDTLRRLMDIAVERGAIHTNPVNVKPTEGRLKKKVTSKKLVLPSSADVQRLYHAMENNGARGGWGIEAADFCRFMNFSGCRVGEVPLVTWKCVDWEKKLVKVSGYKSETSDRIIPLFPALEALLKKIIERRKKAAQYATDGKAFIEPNDPIFRITECQKTIDAACAKIGIPRITHHDFRHLFATTCIESGVDIQTVSRWLGHADGGALAMKTYGHLRQDHSQAQAAKVNFGG